MRRQFDFELDCLAIREWLDGKSTAASADMKAKLSELWWAYKEAVDRNGVLTTILVSAAAKSLSLDAKTAATESAE